MTAAPHFTATVWQRTKDRQCFITIPHRNHDQFGIDETVVLSLADTPAVRMRSRVRDAGGGKRYAKIMRRGQAKLADQFAKDVEVRVELVEEEKSE